MPGENQMSLKFLNIVFQEMNDLFAEIDKAIKSGHGMDRRKKNILTFDSVKTFNTFMTVNRVQILRAISQFKPESIYQLATFLGREPQHVLKDCRFLESSKFIKLEKTKNVRNSLRPVLVFNFDVIKTNSPIIPPYAISEKAEKLLLNAHAG
jgi:predicted transcriptional regulator